MYEYYQFKFRPFVFGICIQKVDGTFFCFRASFMENGSAMIEIAWPRAGKWHFFYADKGTLCFDYLAAFSRKLRLYSTAKMIVNLSVTL